MISKKCQKGLLVTALCLAGAGCGAGARLDPLNIPEGCNPLASAYDCLLPFPSDFFLLEDAALPSGQRVLLGGNAAMYTPADHRLADPTSVHAADGFSTTGPILAVFRRGFDPENLVFHQDDVFVSLTPESPTVVLEADTLEPMLHFAEPDAMADSDERRALIIRPLLRLKNSTRYLVAVHGLLDREGRLMDAPEGFRRLRDGRAAGDPALQPLAGHFESDVFPFIEEFGIERESLQLAWDFTTSSEENQTRDLLRVRQLLMEYFTAHQPQVAIVSVTDDYDEKIFRRVEGTIRVPLFVDSPDPNSRLLRDAAGNVTSGGEADVPFSMLIPRSVASRGPQDPPARLLQYGHGFFAWRDGDFDESGLLDTLQQGQFVLVAADWWGMTRSDSMVVIDAIAGHPSDIAVFSDRVHQGMANFMALAYAALGPLAAAPEIQVDERPLYDTGAVYFYGNSQGHILGGTYVALSPQVDRAVLGVGGAALSLMMSRARPFVPFLDFIRMYLPDPLDIQKYLTLAQMTLDRIDPLTYTPHLLADTFPGSPPARRVLMHMGCEDTEVPNLATQLHARAAGLRQLPATIEVPDLQPADYPLDGSGLVIFDFGVPPVPPEARAADDGNGVHTGLRKLPAAVSQIVRFLKPGGLIEQTCDGLCDPE